VKDFLIAELKKLAEKQKSSLSAEEFQQELELIDAIDWPMKDQVKEVHLGSVVKLDQEGRAQWYLVSPVGGGNFIVSDTLGPMLVVSAFSSLGQELLGKKIGESFQVLKKSFKLLELQ